MNKVQKIIMAISIALIGAVIAMGIADDVGSGRMPIFDWQDTWQIWAGTLGIITLIEILIFRTKK
ncbi:MAG: hypothetical protein Q7T11_06730 [Deltaproteobacteria bacterium]|nr:hypothetical protein [Deltaproteobacteria bacterium]